MFLRWRTLLLFLPLLFIAARCVDQTTMYRDQTGNLHVVGEIHNDTDYQGLEVVVGGTLYDGAGNVLATGQARICPYELSPHTFSGFDIEFPGSSGVPQPSRYEVRVIAGKVVSTRLPVLQAKLSTIKARRSGQTVEITGSVSADPGFEGNYYGCVAFYDDLGNVIRQTAIAGFGLPSPNRPQDMDLVFPGVPAEALKVRLWIVGPGNAAGTSNYRATVTAYAVIQ